MSPSLVNDNTSVAYNTYGFSDDNGEEFVNDTDIALDGLNFSGSIADIRSALVYMYEYISNSHTGTTALKGTLASIDKLTLNINGDAKITPNDLGYIKFLTNYVENKNDPEINVNVAGNVTFDSGTGDYNDENIKDVITDKFTLSASGTITLPNGSDVNEFFGSGKVVKNNTVIADGKEYITNENNNFISASTIRIDGLTSLYTGILKDFKINLTNSGTAKQVKAIITLSGITTDDIALLQYYE
ncbi:MAG: hypothetical protein LBU14_00070 [Candidatus Peribacteria bacterium]|nr:hypothetical protein [Candidatus Peribacteria bacterium]